MGRLMTVATCSLNQWALDWEGNLARIKESIHEAKARGATLRVGPELEVCGYGCLDHFLEGDLYLHCWEMLLNILNDASCHSILLDIGMPVIHRNNRFNSRIIALNGKIILIRPKLWLANDGNYREMRYFIPWGRPTHVEEYYLPRLIANVQGSQKVPIGDAVISTPDTCFGAETCEELFTPNSPHNAMGLNGVEIFTNSSGSHHSLRKLDTRISLIQEATRKNGGVYLYSNQQGCDGDRLYYDGCAMVIINGEIVAQGSQFSLNDVEVVTAVVDIEEVRAYRFAPSRGLQSLQAPTYQRIETTFSLSSGDSDFDPNVTPSRHQSLRVHKPEEEIALGPACWLWDYLRRSKAAGFLVPLSGGIDSCATAVIVFSMCRIIMDALKNGNTQVKADVQRIAGAYEAEDWFPKTPQELCNRIFHTVYMGMAAQSSKETRSRAERLAKDIGAYHTDMNIDDVFHAEKGLLTQATGFEPQFKVHGGAVSENLALQNIQARTRMVTAYYFAQMLPTVRKRPGGGGLLVLGSANVDECLRGYLTKYDCSSADINPIGSISKTDLKRFIHWACSEFSLPILDEFIDAIPTAELEPITHDYVQSDEADMGMTYDELSIFGKLRKEAKLGPYGMFQRLLHDWRDKCSPSEVAVKVKRFHHFYAINRHKMTTMTPAYHAEGYSPDDNRFDLRPFLYPAFFESWSFKRIDEVVAQLEKEGGVNE
ncbi:glutamine-dependent NAD(+) synthetase with GAT domain-containing protein [Lindgomyces ingoldianus]|uniref:Glutamine-dependent NAD(+) synthetase with GAT domain-containing protein n=1 Tax=Lindgomyces ingoldianus TaxID=673940 RepID=A0ACB6QF59_9PLEO|nr:glutamine-dependent NAD(+) synthetase with GAT domain-containing protein [Lindgomyces ingoldianus]KAF2465588.1 glutamine-dependent NAD(+) synthetase with GAT domain-containing protein [Lindgomyces ingoldianus]